MSDSTDAVIDLRQVDDLERLADSVAGRYLLGRAEARTIRLLFVEELRSVLDLIAELQAKLAGEPLAEESVPGS
jgi:hypothetical protein